MEPMTIEEGMAVLKVAGFVGGKIQIEDTCLMFRGVVRVSEGMQEILAAAPVNTKNTSLFVPADPDNLKYWVGRLVLRAFLKEGRLKGSGYTTGITHQTFLPTQERTAFEKWQQSRQGRQ